MTPRCPAPARHAEGKAAHGRFLGVILAGLVAASFAASGSAGAQQSAPVQDTPSQGAPASGGSPESGSLVARLFVETCLGFPGNSAGLRAGLAQLGVPQLPPPVAGIFLGSRPGVVYDTSVDDVRLALASADDGSCSAYAETAVAAQTVQALEATLSQAGIAATLMGEHVDPQTPALSHRDYRAMIGGRPWLILVTTTTAPGQIQAVLTLRSE